MESKEQREMRSVLARSISANDMESTALSDWIVRQDARILIDILKDSMYARKELDETTTKEMASDIQYQCCIVTSVALQRIGIALVTQAIRSELHRRLEADLENGGDHAVIA